MKKCSDNNVKSLYDLENKELPEGRQFRDCSEAQAYVHFVTAAPLWSDDAGLPRYVKVLSNGDSDFSEAQQPNQIWIANRHLNQQVVLHELAHFFRPRVGQDHGPAFINFYLTLIDNMMGLWYGRIYREAFRREGIKF